MGCTSSENVNMDYMISHEPDISSEYDYRHFIISAYIRSVALLLDNEENDEYDIFLLIPTTLSKIIEKYYQHFEIYNISIRDLKIRNVSELEYLIYNCSRTNIFYDGNNKLYIKDFENKMHAFVENEFEREDKEKGNINSFIFSETYCFSDFMCGSNEIELIKHSLYNEYRKIIKLKNGNIYTQYSKNPNGWKYISKLKRINIIEIDCGFDHTLFLTLDGQVYSQGNNVCGQCGIIKRKNGIRINDSFINTPTLIDTFIANDCNIKSISCGHGHNVCIDNANDKQGFVWMFGRNKVWQCTPNYIDQEEELYLPTINRSFVDTKIIKAKCGNDFTVLLSQKGFLYGLGNINGQINLEIKGVSLLSIRNDVIDVECSSNYVVWQTNQNKIYSLESKQSWWYGWNRNRTFTQDWNSSKPIYWKSFKNNHHRMLVGKRNFILFTN